MLVLRRVSRSNGKNKRRIYKMIFRSVSDAPVRPEALKRKSNLPVSRRLLKKRGEYDPVCVHVEWTYIR